MTNLFCFGLGYSATHFVSEFGSGYARITGTVRDSEKADRLARQGVDGQAVEALVFDGSSATPEVAARLADADHVLISAPPDEAGDPVLRCLGDTLAGAKRLSSLVYLSTLGVYGNHDGRWIDETTTPAPRMARTQARLAAEAAWQTFGRRAEKPVAILRLAGIYGPGQNAIRHVVRGTARRIVKPDQVFNRIHVADIAQAIAAAFARHADGIFNVCDDEPTPPGDPIVFAAGLIGVPPPPEIPYDEAARQMTPMAQSFYADNRRARNDKLKRELGVRLRYPNYRAALKALFDDGEAEVARSV
jgi:nucleoside-diphosphate-sugar epimerase